MSAWLMMQKQTVEHIRRLNINGGGCFELPSVSRNMNRFYDIFLSGKALRVGCRARLFYSDSETPFDEIVFSETIHTNNNDWIVSISRWDLRRDNYRGEFEILIMIYAVDGSEICEINIPVTGKRAVKCKNRV